MSYKIEKNVPIEPNRMRRRVKYPWDEMESGDSILMPVEEGDNPEDARRKYSNSAREWLRRNREGWVVRTRLEENGIRLWLVKA